MVRTGIGKARMVLGGEIDACKLSNEHDIHLLIAAQYGTVSRRTRTIPSIG